MVAPQFHHRSGPAKVSLLPCARRSHWVGLAVLAALVGFSITLPAQNPPPWLAELSSQPVGPFPMIPPFQATFRFGWSGIEAASAEARLTIKGGIATVRVKGKTTGMARGLWRLDATQESSFRVEGLKPIGFRQVEEYHNRRLTTESVFKPEGLWRLRQRTPNGGPSKWKHIAIEPIRDIVSAMFFLRSQALAPGDKNAVIAFPGDSPFLFQSVVGKREMINLGGKPRKAIRLDFQIQRIELKKNEPPRLQHHSKFRKGTVWISDDHHRFPLRAEVNIFIGSVFAEMETLTFSGTSF